MAKEIAVWVEELYGSWPRWELLRAHGVRRVYFPAMEATKEHLALTRKDQGFEVGIYRDPSWPWDKITSGKRLAEEAHLDLKDAGFGSTTLPTSCAYDFDIENQDPVFLMECLGRWRELRPTRMTGWSLQSFWSAWIKPLATKLNADKNLTLKVQPWNASMHPFAPDESYADLKETAGITRVEVMRDGARLPVAFSTGTIFTESRIP